MANSGGEFWDSVFKVRRLGVMHRSVSNFSIKNVIPFFLQRVFLGFFKLKIHCSVSNLPFLLYYWFTSGSPFLFKLRNIEKTMVWLSVANTRAFALISNQHAFNTGSCSKDSLIIIVAMYKEIPASEESNAILFFLTLNSTYILTHKNSTGGSMMFS